MSDVFVMKRGDTLPAIQRTLKFDDGTVQDLTGASSVKLIHAPANGNTPDTANALVRTATIVDAANGVVRYDWVAGDTSTVGERFAEFEVDFGGGSKLTFPNGDGAYIRLRIVRDIGDG